MKLIPIEKCSIKFMYNNIHIVHIHIHNNKYLSYTIHLKSH